MKVRVGDGRRRRKTLATDKEKRKPTTKQMFLLAVAFFIAFYLTIFT